MAKPVRACLRSIVSRVTAQSGRILHCGAPHGLSALASNAGQKTSDCARPQINRKQVLRLRSQKLNQPTSKVAAGGMALIAVLWIVAALSIIVTGVGSAVRSEVRLVSGARDTVVGSALGDAAIHLVLQEMVARPEGVVRLTRVNVTYQNQSIAVDVLPLNGLIDINNAPVALLGRMFFVAAGLPPDAAEALAQAVVDTRTKKNSRGQADGFEAIEDLLRVPGLDYAVYANIAGLVTADKPGSGRVNPMAAPQEVLVVLADGNVERASRIAADREAGLAGIDTTTTLIQEYIDAASTQRYRIQAHVPLPSGVTLQVSRSVELGGSMDDGLPWRTFHVEQRLETAPAKGN